MTVRPWIVAVGSLVALTTAAADERPNLVFVIADDWSYPHAGAYGDPAVRTPHFDRLAREGVLFTQAYCAAPSCTASRGAILTGREPHSLTEGANLWSTLPAKFPTFPDVLEGAGYAIGRTGKGWGPGRDEPGGRSRNPAGLRFKDFDAFLADVPKGKPFCYWYGSSDPHRPYEAGSGARAGLDAAKVVVPPFLPDRPEVRGDLLDYLFEVGRFDDQLGAILERLDDGGLAANTLVIVTSDNGMPFPRAKANLYDGGTRVPLVLRWPGRLPAGRVLPDFARGVDLAPTILAAAGLPTGEGMVGLDLVARVVGSPEASWRETAFIERERHANVRQGDLGYPARAVRTDTFLYIRNFEPARWPAGDPTLHFAVGPFGDIDDGPTKRLILAGRDDAELRPYFELACGQRPAEELYDLTSDPGQVRNVAAEPGRAAQLAAFREQLERWMLATGDPRANPGEVAFDRYPYYGGRFKE